MIFTFVYCTQNVLMRATHGTHGTHCHALPRNFLCAHVKLMSNEISCDRYHVIAPLHALLIINMHSH